MEQNKPSPLFFKKMGNGEFRKYTSNNINSQFLSKSIIILYILYLYIYSNYRYLLCHFHQIEIEQLGNLTYSK